MKSWKCPDILKTMALKDLLYLTYMPCKRHRMCKPTCSHLCLLSMWLWSHCRLRFSVIFFLVVYNLWLSHIINFLSLIIRTFLMIEGKKAQLQIIDSKRDWVHCFMFLIDGLWCAKPILMPKCRVSDWCNSISRNWKYFQMIKEM